MTIDDEARKVARLVEKIRPLLAGQNPDLIGAALADLTATWAAGHLVPNNPDQTAMLRASLLALHVEAVCRLVDVNAKMIGTALGAATPEGRG